MARPKSENKYVRDVVYVPKEMFDQIDDLAKRKGLAGRSTLIRHILRVYLNEHYTDNK